ncbi:MAG: toxin-antitoxin system HicB family antitoxin [Verrucomicrobiaceae bacterium]
MKTMTPNNKAEIRKLADRYAKVVEWSAEDRCYVGRVPALHYGGVHGKDRAKVFAELCDVAEEIVTLHLTDGRALPKADAGRRYSGRFLLRVDNGLHEALALRASREGQSLNQYCEGALRGAVV